MINITVNGFQMNHSPRTLKGLLIGILFLCINMGFISSDAHAQTQHDIYQQQQTFSQGGPEDPALKKTYSQNELINAGHHFFGGVTSGLAQIIEKTFQKWGQPNAYILGQDAGGALVMGLRYGEGRVFTKAYGKGDRIFWQGPSIGWDAGADGSRVMMLVYNIRHMQDLYERFGGVTGSFYLVAGLGVTAYTRTRYGTQSERVVIVPIRTGVGLRAGGNVGYLKLTPKPTWNPF